MRDAAHADADHLPADDVGAADVGCHDAVQRRAEQGDETRPPVRQVDRDARRREPRQDARPLDQIGMEVRDVHHMVAVAQRVEVVGVEFASGLGAGREQAARPERRGPRFDVAHPADRVPAPCVEGRHRQRRRRVGQRHRRLGPAVRRGGRVGDDQFRVAVGTVAHLGRCLQHGVGAFTDGGQTHAEPAPTRCRQGLAPGTAAPTRPTRRRRDQPTGEPPSCSHTADVAHLGQHPVQPAGTGEGSRVRLGTVLERIARGNFRAPRRRVDDGLEGYAPHIPECRDRPRLAAGPRGAVQRPGPGNGGHRAVRKRDAGCRRRAQRVAQADDDGAWRRQACRHFDM